MSPMSRWIRVTALAVIGLCLALLVFFVVFVDEAERYTAGKRPEQFRRELAGELLDHFGGVFGIAHNSGGSISATREALAHGADIIEIDVVSSRGRLHAAHDSPLRFIGARFFRGPSLEDVWKAAAQAEVIKLDLKESNERYLELVAQFIAAHHGPELLVSSGNRGALARLARDAGEAIRLLSVPSAARLRDLRQDAELRRLIHGVSIRHDRLDDEAARWLEAEGLLVVTWTVNEAARLNEVVALGVDGVTTDNLAIMELLGAQSRGEARLRERVR
jgi:glycerophosphoryl diester phosphodiesterase